MSAQTPADCTTPVYPGQPIHRTAMATALRGTKHETCKDKTKTPGLCELLGLRPFTPHDLRRTAATLAGELGFSEAAIAKCLDHAVTKDDGEKVHRVTGVYNHSKRMPQKLAVLDGVAAESRRIVSEPAPATQTETGLRLVAWSFSSAYRLEPDPSLGSGFSFETG
jgi:hypothetical protein